MRLSLAKAALLKNPEFTDPAQLVQPILCPEAPDGGNSGSNCGYRAAKRVRTTVIEFPLNLLI
jgi:hypothetical protein